MNTYIDFGVDDVDKTSKNDDEIEDVPRITEIILPNRRVTSTGHKAQLPLKTGRQQYTSLQLSYLLSL